MAPVPRSEPAEPVPDLRPFLAAYDEVLASHWPAGTTRTRVPTPFGTTHINSYGPEDPAAPPLILLPGGGATSTVWYAQAARLGRTHRVHAVDLVGDPGRSVAGERPVRTVADLTAWLDSVLGHLGTGPVALGGHSYGAWIALHYALHAPGRVRKLVLVDPTGCFAGFRPAYLLHALPMLLRPSAERTRAFLAWETEGAALAPAWGGGGPPPPRFPAARPVTGPRPAREDLRALDVPTLLLLAGRGRAHDPARVARTARRLLPHAQTTTLAGATHHTLPLHDPEATELTTGMEQFLAP